MSIDTSALRAATEATSSGGWVYLGSGSSDEAFGHKPGSSTSAMAASRDDMWLTVECSAFGRDAIAEGRFIAAASPAVVMELLDEVDRLHTMVANARAHVEGAAAHADQFGACSHEWLSIRALTAALIEPDHGEGRDDAGAVAGFCGDGVEVVVEDRDGWDCG